MEWQVLLDGEFEEWFGEQKADLQDEILAYGKLLAAHGPMLGRPRVDTIQGSKFTNMKELRIQWKGQPWRILFAFDPKRRSTCLLAAISRATSGGTIRIYRLQTYDLQNI